MCVFCMRVLMLITSHAIRCLSHCWYPIRTAVVLFQDWRNMEFVVCLRGLGWLSGMSLHKWPDQKKIGTLWKTPSTYRNIGWVAKSTVCVIVWYSYFWSNYYYYYYYYCYFELQVIRSTIYMYTDTSLFNCLWCVIVCTVYDYFVWTRCGQ